MINPQHILVVEDSDGDFETVQDAARRAKVVYPLVRAVSGEQCLGLLRNTASNPGSVPMLLLLDLNTPGDDGRDVLREVRTDDGLRNLPVIILSASANPRDLSFCYANGANAYHVKHVDHGMHRQMLEQIFTYWTGSVVLPN